MKNFQYSKYAFLINAVLGLLGMGVENGFASVGRPDLVYQKSSLEICFVENSNFDLKRVVLPNGLGSIAKGRKLIGFSQDMKSLIQNIVEKSFRRDLVGVQFTGFQSCQNGRQSDIAILMDNSPEPIMEAGLLGNPALGTAKQRRKPMNSISIHRGIFAVDNDNKNFQHEMLEAMNLPALNSQVDKNSEILFGLTLVHELMHVLGFEHEFFSKRGSKLLIDFDVSEKKLTSRMQLRDASAHWIAEDEEDFRKRSQDIAPFDISSVMNYELLDFLAFSLKVSAVCQVKHSTLTQEERKLLCESPHTRSLDLSDRTDDSILSSGDRAGLRRIYMNTDTPDSWTRLYFNQTKWLKFAIPLISRELDLFRSGQ